MVIELNRKANFVIVTSVISLFFKLAEVLNGIIRIKQQIENLFFYRNWKTTS